MVLVFLWLISGSTVSYRSVYVVTNGQISFFFLWLSSVPVYVCTALLYAFAWRQTLRSLPYPGFVNTAPGNIGQRVSF